MLSSSPLEGGVAMTDKLHTGLESDYFMNEIKSCPTFVPISEVVSLKHMSWYGRKKQLLLPFHVDFRLQLNVQQNVLLQFVDVSVFMCFGNNSEVSRKHTDVYTRSCVCGSLLQVKGHDETGRGNRAAGNGGCSSECLSGQKNNRKKEKNRWRDVL